MGLVLAIIAAALVFGGGGGSSSSTKPSAPTGASCTSVTLTKAALKSALADIRSIVADLGPSDSALELVRRIMKHAAPDCSWSDSMVATVTTPDGKSFAWQDVVAHLHGMTLQQAANDAELQRILAGMKAGKEGVSYASQYNDLQQAVYQSILMSLARDTPVPYIPAGKKAKDSERFYRWGGYYFHTIRSSSKWHASAFFDPGIELPLYQESWAPEGSDTDIIYGDAVEASDPDEARALSKAHELARSAQVAMG